MVCTTTVWLGALVGRRQDLRLEYIDAETAEES